MQTRTVHVAVIDDYFPELCELTLPTIEHWARRIGARLNLITRRRWPDWPVLTEKLQVWYDGADSDWNILLDADILVHPETPDMLDHFVRPNQVGVKDAYDAHRLLRPDEHFRRDGRNIGISGCAIATSRWCHDLWRPVPDEITREEVCAAIASERKIVDEYCVSRNLARYGLKMTAILDPQRDYNRFFHLGSFGQDPERILDLARKWRAVHWS